MRSAIARASTIWSGTITTRRRRVLRQASVKLTSPSICLKCSSVKAPLSANTASRSAWTIGMTMSSARKASEGRRSANGRNRSVRVPMSPPFSGPTSFHLAGTARSPVGTPALRVGLVDRLLNERALLVEHRLDWLAFDRDPYECVRDRLVEIVALGTQPHRQRHYLGVLRIWLLGDRVGFKLEALVEVVGELHIDNREEAVLTQSYELGLRLQ